MDRLWLLLLATCLIEKSVQLTLEIDTPLGPIKGSVLRSISGQSIFAFRGIRYAQPPIGNLRFAAPVAYLWNGTYDATLDGDICPQELQAGTSMPMSEDCLVLNVYSRNVDESGNATVLVYIHDGRNIAGGSNSEHLLGPDYLVDTSDVVLVTLNYRLGPLGHLSTGTEEAPGNNAYKDQAMALEWVRDNIHAFGGNATTTTLMGSGAGAAAVTLHMVSPLSKGLFARAIAMSGSATSHIKVDNQMQTQRLAEAVHCPMFGAKNVLECLRAMPWQTIVSAVSRWDYVFQSVQWFYEIEKVGQRRFLTDDPNILFLNGHFARVPLLAGLTKDEMDFQVKEFDSTIGMFADLNENFDKYAPKLLMYNANDNNTNTTTTRLREFYFGKESITAVKITKLGQMYSDAMVNHGVHRLVQLASYFMPVYYYRSDYSGRYSLETDEQGKPLGVVHGDDVQYLLIQKDWLPQVGVNDPDFFMVTRMTNWWTSFALTGSPSIQGNLTWLPTNASQIRTMFNNDTPRLGYEPYSERFALWDSLFPLLRKSTAPHIAVFQTASGLIALQFILRTLL